jgi:two-component system, OmpR family, phosphate regulon response regulator PhoB
MAGQTAEIVSTEGVESVSKTVLDMPEESARRSEVPVDGPTRTPSRQPLHPIGPQETVTPAAFGAAEPRPARTILVAEDDHSCRSALHHYFERSGYRVTEAADGPSSLRAVFSQSADLVILDLGLPGVDGVEVLSKIRRHSAIPVIVCSGRDSEDQRIRILNMGADDFVVKPFSFGELEARVRAVLRRGVATPASTRITHGDLCVDRGTRTVTLGERVIPMTRKEFDLLAFMAASPGQVFSREDLLERVWGSTAQWQGRSTVTEHVRRVRLKIEADSDHPEWITTVRGIGYKFCAPEE